MRTLKAEVEKGRKARRKQKDEEKNVVKAEDIEGYRGNKDIDSLLEFLGEEEGNKKKSKKTNDKVVVEKNTKKVTTATTKSDISKDDQKLRKKKEKSQEKESVRPPVTKKLSSDTIDNDVIEEDVEEDTQEVRTSEEPENNSVRQSISPEKDTVYPPHILETVKTTAPSSSNDSGHVSAGPCSLPSISSTKEMSIASSPPLDLDPEMFSEDSVYKDIGVMSNEFTKVTKKQRKKKKSSRVNEAGVRATSQGPETEPAGGWSWRSGYRAMRGSREAVTGTKSTCSVPPSEASDTDDHDSVHSLPVGSTRTKVSVSVASVSSGHTPHASYADIARHAAALQTQQQGQQQQYQLQFRASTPSNTKESVSSTEDYFYNPELDSSFPPVQLQSEVASHKPNSSQDNSNNNNDNNVNNNISDDNSNNNPPAPPPPTDSLENKTVDDKDNSEEPSDNKTVSKKSKLRQNQSDPSLLLPPVVILQNNDKTETAETSGFTFGFEVNESLLAMSLVSNGNNIDENSDTP